MNVMSGKSEKQVLIDSLTGLANQQLFSQHLSNEFKKAHRYNQHLALLLIDINNFERYNDIHGYSSGSLLLRSLAQYWSQCIGFPGDMLARCGDDNFAAILSYTNEIDARVIAQKFITISHQQNTLISIGIALSHEVNKIEDLMHLAHQRLHQAQISGQVVSVHVRNEK